MLCIRLALLARIAGAAPALALVVALVPATAARADHASAEALLLPAAGWQGRPIQRPHHHDSTAVAAAARPLRGWTAGPVSLGAGLHRRSGSERVREVQRRLLRLGYRPGPVDGIYGRRTRAAMGWFQRKHGQPVDGRATLATVRHMRHRLGSPGPQTSNPAGSSDVSLEPAQPTVVTGPPDGAAAPDDAWPGWRNGLLIAVTLLFLPAGFALGRRQSGTAPLPASPAPEPQAGDAASPFRVAPGRRDARAIGYVRLAPGAPSASFHAQAAAIETGCAARGIGLATLISDVEPGHGSTERQAGLALALERIGTGRVDRLIVSRLDHLTRSRDELDEMLELIAERDAALIVLDLDLDTSIRADRAALEAMDPARTTPAAVSPRPVDLRYLARHVALMRIQGVGPEEIAGALNAERVPTPWGASWEPEAVQEAFSGAVETAGRSERPHV